MILGIAPIPYENNRYIYRCESFKISRMKNVAHLNLKNVKTFKKRFLIEKIQNH